jgi:molybdenum cofactor cytidylyltransferase
VTGLETAGFAGIVLAAGRAKRFGEGEGAKLLQQLGPLPVIGHVLKAAAGLSPLVVVYRKDNEALNAAILEHAPRAILAPVDNDALSDSLRAGIAKAVGAPKNTVKAAFLLLADMPLVDATLLGALAEAWDETCLAVAPTHEGQRGNPILLSARAFPLVNEIAGDRGLGPILNARANEVRLVETGAACLLDVDTREDLTAARRKFTKGDWRHS